MESGKVWNIELSTYNITSVLSSDINECKNKSLCSQDPNTHCVNIPGSYKCECNDGYKEKRNGKCEGNKSSRPKFW